ncbi:hypothetical protein G9P44_006101 [Scheffersomyces stipitis]|nr:hypothetical protein G9P44_006101 [Scheffersomyces stipitis]
MPQLPSVSELMISTAAKPVATNSHPASSTASSTTPPPTTVPTYQHTRTPRSPLVPRISSFTSTSAYSLPPPGPLRRLTDPNITATANSSNTTSPTSTHPSNPVNGDTSITTRLTKEPRTVNSSPPLTNQTTTNVAPTSNPYAFSYESYPANASYPNGSAVYGNAMAPPQPHPQMNGPVHQAPPPPPPGYPQHAYYYPAMFPPPQAMGPAPGVPPGVPGEYPYIYAANGYYQLQQQPNAGPVPSHQGAGSPYEENNALMNKRRIIKRRTRTGCFTCRKRRIKCDERKPTCYNCERSKKVCLGYENLNIINKKKRDTSLDLDQQQQPQEHLHQEHLHQEHLHQEHLHQEQLHHEQHPQHSASYSTLPAPQGYIPKATSMIPNGRTGSTSGSNGKVSVHDLIK